MMPCPRTHAVVPTGQRGAAAAVAEAPGAAVTLAGTAAAAGPAAEEAAPTQAVAATAAAAAGAAAGAVAPLLPASAAGPTAGSAAPTLVTASAARVTVVPAATNSGDGELGGSVEASGSSKTSNSNRENGHGGTSQHSITTANTNNSFRSSSSAEAPLLEGTCQVTSACGDYGIIHETNRKASSSSHGSMDAGSFTTSRNNSNSSSNGNFVSDALLRQLEFEDFSRASCWEQLQHEFASCLRGLPIVAARSRYLEQVATAHAEAAAAATAAATAGTPSCRAAACMHSSANCSSSWHEYPVPPQMYSCMCCSPQQQQQQQRCALSLHLFAPLVLQLLLPIPSSPDSSVNSGETPRGQLLRLTYTCAPPLPELSCCCRNSSKGAFTDRPGAEPRLPDQHISGLSVSPVFFSSGSTSGYNIGSSSKNINDKELRCGTCAACALRWEQFFPSRAPSIQRSFGVSEFLQLESVRLPEAAGTAVGAAAAGSAQQDAAAAARATAAAAIPLRVQKEIARASLAALGLAARAAEPCQHGPGSEQQQQQQLLSQLPLFSVYDPQHEDCVGSQVLRCPANAGPACAAGRPLAAAAAAVAATVEAERETRKEFLHLLLPHLGARLQQARNQGGQQYALSLLQQLTVTAQYTYFLPGPWQQLRSSGHGDGAFDAAHLVGAEAWRQQQTNNTFNTVTHPSSSNSSRSNSSSGTNRSRPSESIIRGWREVALGAAIPSLDPDNTPIPSADRLLQLLLLQRCPFEALHVVWCSPLQPLRDFWNSSRSSCRPLAAAFDCRLRLNLYAPLLRAHGRLLQHYSLSLRTVEQQMLHATDFLQEDIWRKQCGVTSRVHQLSRLLLVAGSSSSIRQQPFASLTPKTFRGVERTRRGQAPHSLSLPGRSAAASKHRRRGSRSPKGSSPRSSSMSSSGDEASEYSTSREAEIPSIEAEVQQLFRPMTRQQQLLIHQQQVKRLLLAGSRCCNECTCCCSACGCCGIDLAFGLLWGSSSSNSFFAELALCAGKQQRLSQLQRLWQKLLMKLRWMWDQGLLLPRVVSGLTAATATSCAVQAAAAARPATAATDATPCEAWSALAAGLGVACCPDGPSALPDVCCCSLQQLLQQLNCATQQQRLRLLLQDMPKEKEQQQPFESLRFVLPGISHLHEPIIPILPPVTENTLAMHMALLRERRSGAARRAFGDHCEELFRLANKEAGTPQACAAWWQHCFAHLPRSVEQLLHQREQLLEHQRAARSAAAAALRPSAYTREGVLQAARAATTSAVTAVSAATAASSEDSQRTDFGQAKCSDKVDKQQPFFSSLVEGEGALHGLESLTATELLGQLLRVLVASLVEQCRLACACVLVSSGSQESRCCTYSPGVAAAHFGHSSSGCKGQLFPCHIPALQTAADDLQRHAIAHAAGAAPAAAEDGLAWLPPLALLAACMRCEYVFSAAVGLCRLIGTDPPALAVVNRALQLLLLRLHQQEEAAARTAGSSSNCLGDSGDHAGRKFPEAECDILVPILSCSEKWALQQMLSRCHGSTKNSSAATGGIPAPPWEAVLPWPPFAQEFVFLLQPHTSDGKQQGPQRKWAFYCREQHADRTFAVAGERPF